MYAKCLDAGVLQAKADTQATQQLAMQLAMQLAAQKPPAAEPKKGKAAEPKEVVRAKEDEAPQAAAPPAAEAEEAKAKSKNAKKKAKQKAKKAAGNAEEVAANPSFGGAFFYSRSAGPDGIIRIEWFGSCLIWLLLLLSIIGIGYLVKLATSNVRNRIAPVEHMNRIEQLIERSAWNDALALTRKEPSDFSLITHATLEEAPNGFDAMTSRMELVASEVTADRFRQIEPLNVLGQVAPMIGLFGTVYGMIVAFGSIVASGGAADPVMLAGGIGTALTTTFWGLVVAIPALAGYALLRNKIDELTIEATLEAEELMSPFRPTSKAKV